MLLADRISTIPLRKVGLKPALWLVAAAFPGMIYKQQESVVAVKMESNATKARAMLRSHRSRPVSSHPDSPRPISPRLVGAQQV